MLLEAALQSGLKRIYSVQKVGTRMPSFVLLYMCEKLDWTYEKQSTLMKDCLDNS